MRTSSIEIEYFNIQDDKVKKTSFLKLLRKDDMIADMFKTTEDCLFKSKIMTNDQDKQCVAFRTLIR